LQKAIKGPTIKQPISEKGEVQNRTRKEFAIDSD
jgi:hypothetical protein